MTPELCTVLAVRGPRRQVVRRRAGPLGAQAEPGHPRLEEVRQGAARRPNKRLKITLALISGSVVVAAEEKLRKAKAIPVPGGRRLRMRDAHAMKFIHHIYIGAHWPPVDLAVRRHLEKSLDDELHDGIEQWQRSD
ncbi:unnamed protein product, partial [Mesorhabditis spiculigera]